MIQQIKRILFIFSRFKFIESDKHEPSWTSMLIHANFHSLPVKKGQLAFGFIRGIRTLEQLNQHIHTIRHLSAEMRRIKIFSHFSPRTAIDRCVETKRQATELSASSSVLLNSQQFIVFIKLNFHVFRDSACDFSCFQVLDKEWSNNMCVILNFCTFYFREFNDQFFSWPFTVYTNVM